MTVISVSFIDTNIWLYAFLQKQDAQKSAIARAIVRQGNICISTQVINELCSNLIKKGNLGESQISALVRSLYKRYKVIELTQNIFPSASQLRQKYLFSYWDSLIVAAALSANATTLYSEDMHNGLIVEGTLTITNPFV